MDTGGASTRLVGFRAWLVKNHRLWSIYKTGEWQLGKTIQAHCLCQALYGGPGAMWGEQVEHAVEHERAPDLEALGCGLYAYDRLQTLEQYLAECALGFAAITGVIEVWGRIRAGRVFDPQSLLPEPGYRLRAEYARVVALEKDHPGVFELQGVEKVALVSRRYLEPWAADAFSATRYHL